MYTFQDARKERIQADAEMEYRWLKRDLKIERASLARAEKNFEKFGGEIWQNVVNKRRERVAAIEGKL